MTPGAATAGAALLRRSAQFLALLGPLVAIGFWPSYFARALEVSQWRIHAHGFLMLAWVVLLLAQAFLVRADRRPVHRGLGRISWILVPLIVASTVSLAHWRLNNLGADPLETLVYFLYVQAALLVQFLAAWTLAMANRRRPLVHARYMLCTALAIFDPIVARIVFNVLGVDYPWLQVVTYGMIDAILLALIAWERRHATGSTVFERMLALFVVTQAPTFFLWTTPAWRSFAAWFAALPLP